jgi:hypothetical protein
MKKVYAPYTTDTAVDNPWKAYVFHKSGTECSNADLTKGCGVTNIGWTKSGMAWPVTGTNPITFKSLSAAVTMNS